MKCLSCIQNTNSAQGEARLCNDTVGQDSSKGTGQQWGRGWGSPSHPDLGAGTFPVTLGHRPSSISSISHRSFFPAPCDQEQPCDIWLALRKRLHPQPRTLLPSLIVKNASVPKSRAGAKWLWVCITFSWPRDLYFCFIFLTMCATAQRQKPGSEEPCIPIKGLVRSSDVRRILKKKTI